MLRIKDRFKWMNRHNKEQDTRNHVNKQFTIPVKPWFYFKYTNQGHHLTGARMVYNKRNETITIAPTKVNPGLVHSMRFDLSVFLMGSTSSEIGNSDRLGFQLTYLSGENWEKSVFLPCFLKFDHALSQSVENLSPGTFNKHLQCEL